MSYKAWKEQDKLPDFILEITSKTTQAQDEQDKPIKYAHLGVKEYFQYDPSSDYLKPCLKGRRLVEGKYQEIESTLLEDETVSIYSAVLGLELRIMAGELRFYDPSTDTLYPNYTEMAVRLKQMGIKLGVTENALLQSENALLQSENARIEADNARNEAENARIEAENARIEAENARNEAENARIEAENARIEAENARIEAENACIEAENARIEAENARIEAENEKQEIRERLNQAIKTLQNLGLSQEEIATTLNLPLAQVQEYCTQG
jgi:DNA-binding transcriptional regulator YiaG